MSTGALSILETLDDPTLFQPWFPGPSWSAWRTILKAAFGLPPATKLVGRVHWEFDASRNPTDPGEPIETALASAAELAAQASERAAHEVSDLRPDVGGPRPEAEQGAAYFVRGSVSENPRP